MKNSIGLIVLKVLLFCFCSFVCTEMDARSSRSKKVDLKFGAFSRDCRGFGICLIYDPFGPDPATNSVLSSDGDIIKIEIPFLRVKENPGLFEGGYFIMEEPYEIPLSICKSIGLEFSVVLPKGKHKISQGSERLIIEFDTQN
ncbi:MAG: hypothetical protein EYC69_04290 [Bacteroidetes bacterium]|nr:MAG: hypothetical protein EYC69_04290 [Bacteroidota bacterium]